MNPFQLARGPFLLAVVLGSSSIGSAQIHPSWIQTGAATTSATVVAVDAAGNAYVAGGAPAAASTIEVSKYAPDGTQLWSTDYVDPAHHHNSPRSIAVDTDGSVYVAGSVDYSYTFPPPVINQVFAVLKYSPSGTLEWISAPFAGGAVAIALDHAGGVFAAGFQGNSDASVGVVQRYSTAGAIQWSSTVAGNITALAVPAPNQVFVGGSALVSFTSDMYLARIDASNGSVVWSQTLDEGAQGLDRGNDIAADGHGNVAIGGFFTINANGNQVMGVALYDDQGQFQWKAEQGGPTVGGHEVRKVAIDALGRVVVTGNINHNDPRGQDITTIVYDHAGNQVWLRSYDSGLRDYSTSLALDGAGDIFAVGWRPNYAQPYSQGVALGYDPSGAPLFTFVYPDPSVPVSGAFGAVASGLGQSLVLVGTYTDAASSRALVVRLDPDTQAYCFGDGGGTACPCGNDSAPSERAGCATSLGVGGRLDFIGVASLSDDSLTLLGTNMPDSSALYFQGTAPTAGGSGSTFGDGLRCAGGTVTRLATHTNTGGASQFPSAGDAAISIRGVVPSPGSRTYQVWFRNSAAFCSPSTFNLTNGLQVTWTL
jgi:hypothetical protein